IQILGTVLVRRGVRSGPSSAVVLRDVFRIGVAVGQGVVQVVHGSPVGRVLGQVQFIVQRQVVRQRVVQRHGTFGKTLVAVLVGVGVAVVTVERRQLRDVVVGMSCGHRCATR